jgi:hypothetical protein
MARSDHGRIRPPVAEHPRAGAPGGIQLAPAWKVAAHSPGANHLALRVSAQEHLEVGRAYVRAQPGRLGTTYDPTIIRLRNVVEFRFSL